MNWFKRKERQNGEKAVKASQQAHQTDGLSPKDTGEMGFHREFHDLEGSICSSMDCTGLIPTPPQSNAEEEAYEELYPYLPDAAAGKHEDSFS